MRYASIRIVEADTLNEAINKVVEQDFNEPDPLCDAVIPLNDVFHKALLAVHEDINKSFDLLTL